MTDEKKGFVVNIQWIHIIVACVLFALAMLCAGFILGYANGSIDSKASIPAAVPTVVSVPTPTPVPTPAAPQVITYTVLSMTTAYGDYRIVTTTGLILICQNSYDYNLHEPQDTYTSTISGITDGKYYLSSSTLISQHYNTVRDYRGYYRYDGDYRDYYGKQPCAGNMVCG